MTYFPSDFACFEDWRENCDSEQLYTNSGPHRQNVQVVHRTSTLQYRGMPWISTQHNSTWQFLLKYIALQYSTKSSYIYHWYLYLHHYIPLCLSFSVNNWPVLRLDGTVGGSKRTQLVDIFNDPMSISFAFLLSSKVRTSTKAVYITCFLWFNRLFYVVSIQHIF